MSVKQSAAKKRAYVGKAPYKRRPNIPSIKVAEVVGLYMTSRISRSQIARDLGLNRETVSRILSQEQNQLLIQKYRQTIIEGIVPNALIGLAKLVNKEDRQAIIETLYGSRILIQRSEVEQIKAPERTYAYPKIEFFAKYGRWPSLEEAKRFEKTLDVQPLTITEEAYDGD